MHASVSYCGKTAVVAIRANMLHGRITDVLLTSTYVFYEIIVRRPRIYFEGHEFPSLFDNVSRDIHNGHNS